MKLDGVTTIAMILIASFAIDRIVTALLFLLSFITTLPDPKLIQDTAAHAAAERKYKLFYFVAAGALGTGVLAYYGQVRILSALGIPGDHPVLDIILTGIVLMGGADRMAALLKMSGAPGETSAPQPLEITGRLTLEGGTPQEETALKKAAGHGA